MGCAGNAWLELTAELEERIKTLPKNSPQWLVFIGLADGISRICRSIPIGIGWGENNSDMLPKNGWMANGIIATVIRRQLETIDNVLKESFSQPSVDLATPKVIRLLLVPLHDAVCAMGHWLGAAGKFAPLLEALIRHIGEVEEAEGLLQDKTVAGEAASGTAPAGARECYNAIIALRTSFYTLQFVVDNAHRTHLEDLPPNSKDWLAENLSHREQIEAFREACYAFLEALHKKIARWEIGPE